MRICSACLLGIDCRHDGKTKPNKKVLELAKTETLIPVCPEQLGGLSTPRPATEISDDSIITKDGQDISDSFHRGAHETLKIAKLFNIKKAILKTRSPSCGCGKIYDGTFKKRLIKGDGITTKLLKENNIKIITEKEL